MSVMLFPLCLFDISIYIYVIQTQPGIFHSERQGYYSGFVSFSSTRPLSFSASVSVSLHLPLTFFSFTPHSLHSVFPACWRMNCQRCLQYQLLRRAREAENREVKSERCGARLFRPRHQLPSCVTHLSLCAALLSSGVCVILISFSHFVEKCQRHFFSTDTD